MAEDLHEKIVEHLNRQAKQAKLVADFEALMVSGIKTTQGGKPVCLIDCPNHECSNVFGMSGHEPGRIVCNVCGTLCVVTPVDPPG